jgi:pimeloyl-ACP methyl ester carboxylesterase
MGSGEPLVLFHGVMGSERHWRHVAPLLAPGYDVIAVTALGHRGGPVPVERPVTFAVLVDEAERQLDGLGIDRAHLAGNSLGGWMALELARRGRARSVCALSPAGMWDPVAGPTRSRVRLLREAAAMSRLTRPVLPVLLLSPAMRRFGLRHVALNGDRLAPAYILELTDDLLGCRVAEDFFATRDSLPAVDSLPCPITLAWSEFDRIFPEHETGAIARQRLPGARYVVLDHVGHVPMFDDPALVARVIAETAAAGR